MKPALLCYLAIILLSACGKDSDDGKCKSGCRGYGFYQELVSGINEINFKNTAAGQEYAVIPFIAGDESINGTSAEQVGTLGPRQSELVDIRQTPAMLPLNFDQQDHRTRRLFNTVSRREVADHMNESTRGESIERAALLKAFSPNMKRSLVRSVDSACLEELDLEFIGVDKLIDSSDFIEKKDIGDFCLIVLGESAQTISDLSTLTSSIATAYGNYKLIYDTDFDTSVDGYKFKPNFILLPFDNSDYWPLGDEMFGGVTGAYFHQLSDDNGRPILILPTNMSVVNKDLAKEEAEEKYHATIAHELHHAIVDFYRFWVNGNQTAGSIEISSIDEGLAHYMEDINGYGAATFASFTEPFLLRFASSATAIFDNEDSPLSRGAAHALMYYLLSQKGGVQFKDGSVDTDTSASPAVGFLREYVKGDYHGTAGLFKAFGQSKVETLGQFLAALSVDGASNFTPLATFQTQSTVVDVTSTSGQNNRTFGMKFNNFGNIPDVPDRVGDYSAWSEQKPESMRYYIPLPRVYTTEKQDDTVRLELESSASGLGIAIVRIE